MATDHCDGAFARIAPDARHRLKGALVALGTFLGLGIYTALIPNPAFVRMVPRTPLDFLFLGSTALLGGAYVTQRSRASGAAGETCAVGGAFGGFLAFACPVCNHLLLALFGSSAILTYFDPLRPAIGAVSTAILGVGVYYQHRQGR